MKLLLVSLDKQYKKSLNTHFKSLGVDCIHYRDTIKAMDNMEEIEPECVLYNAANYPRHWKVMHAMLRDLWNKDECAFILLAPDSFSEEEEKKAKFLDVTGILKNTLDTPEDIENLKKMFQGYIKEIHSPQPEAKKIVKKIIVSGQNRKVPAGKMVLMFTHPGTFKLITGRITEYTLSEGLFKLDNSGNTSLLKQGVELKNCSLKVGKDILTVDCKVKKTAQECILTFTRFKGKGKKIFEQSFNQTG